MSGGFDRLWWIGPIAFFLAACAFSMLGTQFSTDTWLGLAGGRQIAEQLDWGRFNDTYPRHDTFSYSSDGAIWCNQNWLAHLAQYWLYDHVGPSAVVYANCAVVASIGVLVLLAVYSRTVSWPAAWLAAAWAAIGLRDFLEPRASTLGMLCMAALWAMLCAIEAQRDNRRWWPI